jgi:hypothetical protein
VIMALARMKSHVGSAPILMKFLKCYFVVKLFKNRDQPYMALHVVATARPQAGASRFEGCK